jgi:putative inorganic carbon (HCO3(-)) transporter
VNPRRLAGSLTILGLVTAFCGALAFGAVYPWAYVPLASICMSTGVAALGLLPRHRPPLGTIGPALAAVGVAIAVQVVPLPVGVLDFISPHADAFSAADAAAATHRTISVSPSETLRGIALFVSFAVFFLGLARSISTAGAKVAVRILVAFGVVLALVGILQYVITRGAAEELKIYGFWQPTFHAAPFGPYVNRNHFAGWLIMVLPFALAGAYGAWEMGSAMALGALHDRITWLSSSSAAGTLLMGFAALVMGLALLMSQSRSGMMAFAIAVLLLTGLVIRRQPTAGSKVAVAALFALVLVVVASWAGIDRVGQRVATVRNDANTAGGRRMVWADALRVAHDFPIGGTGLNTFGTAMLLYQTDRELHFEQAHNDYLQLAAEGGLLVALPVAVTIVVFAREVRRRFREAPRYGSTYWIRVGAVIGLLSIALQSLVEFSLQMPANAALFGIVAAIALHQSPNLRPAKAEHSNPGSR